MYDNLTRRPAASIYIKPSALSTYLNSGGGNACAGHRRAKEFPSLLTKPLMTCESPENLGDVLPNGSV